MQEWRRVDLRMKETKCFERKENIFFCILSSSMPCFASFTPHFGDVLMAQHTRAWTFQTYLCFWVCQININISMCWFTLWKCWKKAQQSTHSHVFWCSAKAASTTTSPWKTSATTGFSLNSGIRVNSVGCEALEQSEWGAFQKHINFD